MSFLHLIYVGDFEGSDGPNLRMTRTPDDPIYRPVVRYALDLSVVERLAWDVDASGRAGMLPAAWPIRLEEGYLACDRYALGPEEIVFLKRLVGETGCRLFERGFEVSVDDLTPARHPIS